MILQLHDEDRMTNFTNEMDSCDYFNVGFSIYLYRVKENQRPSTTQLVVKTASSPAARHPTRSSIFQPCLTTAQPEIQAWTRSALPSGPVAPNYRPGRPSPQAIRGSGLSGGEARSRGRPHPLGAPDHQALRAWFGQRPSERRDLEGRARWTGGRNRGASG